MTTDPQPSGLRREIEHLLYSWEAPHFQNPHPKPIEESLLEIIDRERKKAVKEAFTRSNELSFEALKHSYFSNREELQAQVLAEMFPSGPTDN